MTHKVCSKCKTNKPISCFVKRHDSKDGFRNVCKDCKKKNKTGLTRIEALKREATKRNNKARIKFFLKAPIKHNFKYDYSKVVYENNNKEIKICCPIHGMFEQSPSKHLMGQGCNKCSGGVLHTTEYFLKSCNDVWGNKYLLDRVEYNGNKKYVSIGCREHGYWKVTPANFISKKSGCPQCSARRWFVGNNEGEVFIPFIRDVLSNYDVTLSEQHVVESELSQYYVDLYIPEMKLAIEYDEVHHNNKKLKEKDKERQTYIENKLGCTFIRVDDKRFMDDNQYATTLLETYFPNIKKEIIEDLFD